MTAVATRQADQITGAGLPIERLAEPWAVGTGIAVVVVASAYLVALELADPLVVAVPVIGMLARRLPGDRTSVEA